MIRARVFAVGLMVGALLLLTLGVANAALVTTNVLRSWDDGTNRYENGNISMHLDSDRQPFYTRLDFDSSLHADACGPNTSSQWAGDATIGLYHTDDAPAGAPGFVNSGNWELVKCSTFDTNKYPAPADILAVCVEGNPGDPQDKGCVLKSAKDVVVACQPGNCQDEIQTDFHINIDPGDGVNAATKCDNTIDAPFAGLWSSNPQKNDLCMYWDAQKPPLTTPAWVGNLQARYSTSGGGDKTLNFNLFTPTAVNLSALAARADASGFPLAAGAAALFLAAAAVVLWRRS